jgi:hypothetical protein
MTTNPTNSSTFDAFNWADGYINGADLFSPLGRAIMNGEPTPLDDDFDFDATDEYNDNTAETEETALELIADALTELHFGTPHHFDPTGERVEYLRELADTHTDPTAGAWADTLADHFDALTYITPNTYEATRWELAARIVAALFSGDLDHKAAREAFDTLTN